MNGDVGQPYRPSPKPDGIIVWCIGVACGAGAAALWAYALLGPAA